MANENGRKKTGNPDGRRVAVTGRGVISPVGLNQDQFWSSLCEGESGVSRITRFDTTEYPTKIGAEVEGFDPESYVSRKDARRMDVFTHYAIAAAMQAVEESKLNIDDALALRLGVFVGSGGGASGLNQQDNIKVFKHGPKKISAYSAAATSIDAAAGEVAMKLGAKGPTAAIATACASGNSSIGEAMKVIQSDRADVMVAGGSDDLLTPADIAAFSNAKALSRQNAAPEKASRPFDKDRDGFVMGAGAGIVILEELEHAIERGATILAELAGYGATTDAHHATSPDPTGAQARRAMLLALNDAGTEPAKVDYINAHGTSTRLNDKVETQVIKSVFGKRCMELPVSSIKSMIGHLVGGSGAVEFIATVNCLLHGMIPPTINCDNPDDDLNYVPHRAQVVPVHLALSNSFGFGGHNAVLAIRRWTAEQEQ